MLARTTSRAVPFALGVDAPAVPAPDASPGTFSALRPAELPRRDHESGRDRDRDERHRCEPGLARPALPPRRRHPTRAQRRIVLTYRESRVVLVDERLSVEPQRLGVRAEEATHVRGCRQDVEPLVLERAEVLGADLRPLLQLGEVEVLPNASLAEA